MSGPRCALLLAAVVAVCGALPMSAAAQGRPDCAAVLRKMHDSTGHQGARQPDAVKIARKLGVDEEWVEQCAASYGRHVKKHPRKGDLSEDSFSTTHEAEEYEELGREEKETLGDTYYTSLDDDDQDRRKLRRNRDADTINEWEPFETHEWGPNVGHAWSPYLHDDDLKDIE